MVPMRPAVVLSLAVTLAIGAGIDLWLQAQPVSAASTIAPSNSAVSSQPVIVGLTLLILLAFLVLGFIVIYLMHRSGQWQPTPAIHEPTPLAGDRSSLSSRRRPQRAGRSGRLGKKKR